MIAQFFTGLEVVIPLVLLALIAFAIVALVTARRDPDPAGTRPYAIYLVLVIFLALFTALFALTSMASNIARIPVVEQQGGGFPGQRFFPTYDPDKQQTAAAVLGAMIAIAAFAVMWFHVRRLRELVQEPEFATAPGRRTYQVYLHATTFTSAAILIFSGAAAAYGIFRIVAPGYTNQFSSHSAERSGGIVELVSAGILAAGAYLIFAYHWRRTRTLREPTPLPPEDHEPPLGPLGPSAEGPPLTTPPSSPPPPSPPPGAPPPPTDEAPPPVIPPT